MTKAKLLIADDEPNILMLASVLFEDMGYEVVSACNGEEAIDKALSERPDLIITDVIMPKKDGFAVCEAVRNHPDISDTPIIILSAMGDEYNKISGFELGADDYITKPFNVEELKARVNALLLRAKSRRSMLKIPVQPDILAAKPIDFPQVSSGFQVLDDALFGGLPLGSNILVIGSLGRGKSTFARQFVKAGLENKERCLYVAIDDDPRKIRQMLDHDMPFPTSEYEELDLIRFVDAYSWSSLTQPGDERFMVSGVLELNQLSGVVSDAGSELGQTIQNKLGGRRVVDSISSLLINFDLPAVQRFLSQIARTSLAFGGVTTLFILEDGTVSDQMLNNISYIMDGVVEFGEIDGQRSVRVKSMKWSPYKKEWQLVGIS